ncbi:hypothetical protein TW83_10075 [Paracoccus sp. S4493]|uniref:hypothetical protein n=1 Tax=Paracoccus sp. S4493 TaxID=579490 RepID=UPI0005F9F28F|nr:hypothetical protein [Paracoccus sp. S4493]KJZ31258.1 hypothetical protein TW83_10075 [Paracoccus sp. S4493]
MRDQVEAAGYVVRQELQQAHDAAYEVYVSVADKLGRGDTALEREISMIMTMRDKPFSPPLIDALVDMAVLSRTTYDDDISEMMQLRILRELEDAVAGLRRKIVMTREHYGQALLPFSGDLQPV